MAQGRKNPVETLRLRALEQRVGFDYILDTYSSADFTEYVTSTGGDVCRYRVYGSSEGEFRVYAK